MFCQAYRQLSSIASSQFCVRLACGGDPTYSFNVKFTGEEVHGTSKFFYLTITSRSGTFFMHLLQNSPDNRDVILCDIRHCKTRIAQM